jgi:hypothetical protein
LVSFYVGQDSFDLVEDKHIIKSHRITSFDGKLRVDIVEPAGHGFLENCVSEGDKSFPLACGPNMGIKRSFRYPVYNSIVPLA